MQHINGAPRYDEIQTIQVDHLLSVLSSGSGEISKIVHKNLDEKIESYAAGELQHARDAVSLMWESSRQPQNTDATSAPFNWNSFNWDFFIMEQSTKGTEIGKRGRRVRTSLINSIQGRSLLRQRYWARTSRGGRLCPIYFPNVVYRLTFSRIAEREWTYISGSTSVLS